MSKRLVTVSKFLSKYLRHEPEALGLTLKPGGWVSVEDLLEGAAKHDFPITKAELLQVIAESDKQRFALDETEPNSSQSGALDRSGPAIKGGLST